MNKWFFQMLSPAQVETEITQRDQFSNDSVSLNETIVRETIQNSLDASEDSSTQVKVTFRWLDKSHGLEPEYLEKLLKDQRIHAEAAGIDLSEIDFDNPRALIIEDFGTKGLTGKTDVKDDENFSDFWRRHGKSHKFGKSRGRWGLGKLVYSTTSGLGVFFGLTLRANDPVPYLMGQSVLNLYTLNQKQYLPHSFFADQTNPDDFHTNIPIPIRDQSLVTEFREYFRLERTAQSGLSIVIPFPNASFDQSSMIRVAIENYFYPIVIGQLSLVFDDIEITKNNIRDLAHRYAKNMYSNLDSLFNFLEEVSSYPQVELLTLKPSWSDDKRLGEDDFKENELGELRESFNNGRMCAIRLPIELKTKGALGKGVVNTYITTFIKRPEEITQGRDLYVRGGLTLPGERKFRSHKALGVMIADDEAICDFLGDAENPAHTKWNLATEKLGKKYVKPRDSVLVIKNALVNLYDVLAEVKEEKDDTALGKFFSMPVEAGSGNAKGGKKTPKEGGSKSPSTPEVPKLPSKLIEIREISGGFSISTPSGSDESLFPAMYKITLAYDDGTSNPFKSYRTADFKLGKGGKIQTKVYDQELPEFTIPNLVGSKLDNSFVIFINRPPFMMEVTGFDPFRDLKVSARKLKSKIVAPDEAEVE